jgi:hypothetical protein
MLSTTVNDQPLPQQFHSKQPTHTWQKKDFSANNGKCPYLANHYVLVALFLYPHHHPFQTPRISNHHPSFSAFRVCTQRTRPLPTNLQ